MLLFSNLLKKWSENVKNICLFLGKIGFFGRVTKKFSGIWCVVSLSFATTYCYVFLCMDLYKAIQQMRQLSKENIPFSFSFMSYNSTKQHSEGIVSVRRARLRKREFIKHHKNAEIVEAYIDLDTMECKRFYQPLLMMFNGEKISLK